MKASLLLELCEKAGIRFFTGVPDSQLKGLCDELFARYGADGPTHLVAPNEGGAIALCAGHFLATGHPALCYLQNSGLGNAVNPLVSLMDEKVYALPCLLVVGWRGEPGVHDEPQHIRQGEITPGLLELMGIPYFVLSPDTPEAECAEAFGELIKALRGGKCAALLVRKNALSTDSRPSYANGFSLSRESAAERLLTFSDPSDIFVSTTGKLSREVFEIRERLGQDHRRDFLTVGSMGHASLIALKIALEKPSRRVWCLDGDGALLMHLGAMALIGHQRPVNLIHAVFNNGAHETVGGMPVLGGSLEIAGLARSCHYAAALRADSAETLDQALSGLRGLEGPILLEIGCACGARKDLGRPTVPPAKNREAFMDFLSES